ncbi:MAG: hypothetical protein PHE21_03385, partial [Candidatus Dojkabacteria bacterium]|nr:hypothetical protein [Candidatus Dojkabacteria bacterium]
MNNNGIKKRGVYFLIALSVFGYLLYKNTNVINSKDVQDSNPSICQSNTDVVTSTNNNGKDIYLVIQQDGSLKEVSPKLILESGYVLGDNDSVTSCKNVKNSFDDATACAQPFSAGADFKDGNRSGNVVSKNARIELVEVIAPLVLLSGKDTVKDSNRSLTLEDPVYKPAGSIFADKDVYVNVPPGTLHDNVKANIIEGSEKGVYGAETSVSLVDDTTKEAKSEAVIDKKIVNSCEECNNESNTNPDKSNNA